MKPGDQISRPEALRFFLTGSCQNIQGITGGSAKRRRPFLYGNTGGGGNAVYLLLLHLLLRDGLRALVRLGAAPHRPALLLALQGPWGNSLLFSAPHTRMQTHRRAHTTHQTTHRNTYTHIHKTTRTCKTTHRNTGIDTHKHVHKQEHRQAHAQTKTPHTYTGMHTHSPIIRPKALFKKVCLLVYHSQSQRGTFPTRLISTKKTPKSKMLIDLSATCTYLSMHATI